MTLVSSEENVIIVLSFLNSTNDGFFYHVDIWEYDKMEDLERNQALDPKSKDTISWRLFWRLWIRGP